MAQERVGPVFERGFILLLLGGAIVLMVAIVGETIRSTEHKEPATYYEQQIIKTDTR